MIRTPRLPLLALLVLSLTAAASTPTAALAGPGGPYLFITSFDNNTAPPGMKLYGSATIDNQSLHLTSATPGQAALVTIGGGRISEFGIGFDYFFDRPGGGLTADGMSFNLGIIPDGVGGPNLWEKGVAQGLSVSFDIYDFSENGSLGTYGIRVMLNGVVIATRTSAITAADRGQWRACNVAISNNMLTVAYNDLFVAQQLPITFTPDPRYRFAFAARTGAEFAEQRIDNIQLGPAPVSSDSCQNADPIVGDGCFWFSNFSATTDGVAACDSAGTPGNSGIAKDVWSCWTATTTGLAKFSTVGHANFDTKIALYSDCGVCPQGLGLLACNDNAPSSIQSEFTQHVTAGAKYLLRIGASPGPTQQSGVGYIVITTTPDCPADFNRSGAANVQDIFDFLSTWFAGCP